MVYDNCEPEEPILIAVYKTIIYYEHFCKLFRHIIKIIIMQVPRIDHKYHTVISNRDVKKILLYRVKVSEHHINDHYDASSSSISLHTSKKYPCGGRGAGMGTATVFDFHIQPQ